MLLENKVVIWDNILVKKSIRDFIHKGESIMEKKHVVIGVSGGIAAYKACDLVSKLSKKDYEIKVVMTKHAQEFVKPINFESLSKHKCEVSLFDKTNEDPIAHITLAKWADIMVLVPATANIIAKVVHGIADDIVSTTFFSLSYKKIDLSSHECTYVRK